MSHEVVPNVNIMYKNSELSIVGLSKPNVEFTANNKENISAKATEHEESSMPLIEYSKLKPPLARLEIEDLDEDDDDREVASTPYPGVDDGFFGNGEKPADPDVETINPENIPEIFPRAGGEPDEPDGRNIPPHNPPKPFPYPPGFGPDIESGMVPDVNNSLPDINVYQHKKTLAQGMMDLALLSANANQLRYVLESYDRHPYFYPSLVMISLSLIFQVSIGIRK